MQEDHFTELIDSGMQGEVYRRLNQKPWAEGHATLDDLLKADRYLTHLFAQKHRGRARRGAERPPGLLPGRGLPTSSSGWSRRWCARTASSSAIASW